MLEGSRRAPPTAGLRGALPFPPEVLLEGRPDLPLQVDEMAQLSVWDPRLS